MNNNGCNVYKKIYDELSEKKLGKIRPYEFYYMIENMKINSEEFFSTIKQMLVENGFSDHQIGKRDEELKKICQNLVYRLRFTRTDARKIEKRMEEKGLIKRNRNMIIIN